MRVVSPLGKTITRPVCHPVVEGRDGERARRQGSVVKDTQSSGGCKLHGSPPSQGPRPHLHQPSYNSYPLIVLCISPTHVFECLCLKLRMQVYATFMKGAIAMFETMTYNQSQVSKVQVLMNCAENEFSSFMHVVITLLFIKET